MSDSEPPPTLDGQKCELGTVREATQSKQDLLSTRHPSPH